MKILFLKRTEGTQNNEPARNHRPFTYCTVREYLSFFKIRYNIVLFYEHILMLEWGMGGGGQKGKGLPRIIALKKRERGEGRAVTLKWQLFKENKLKGFQPYNPLSPLSFWANSLIYFILFLPSLRNKMYTYVLTIRFSFFKYQTHYEKQNSCLCVIFF